MLERSGRIGGRDVMIETVMELVNAIMDSSSTDYHCSKSYEVWWDLQLLLHDVLYLRRLLWWGSRYVRMPRYLVVFWKVRLLLAPTNIFWFCFLRASTSFKLLPCNLFSRSSSGPILVQLQCKLFIKYICKKHLDICYTPRHNHGDHTRYILCCHIPHDSQLTRTQSLSSIRARNMKSTSIPPPLVKSSNSSYTPLLASSQTAKRFW